MTGAAISLVLLSALLHAVWNFFSKGSNDRWAFFFGQGVATLVAYTPLVIWQWPPPGSMPPAGCGLPAPPSPMPAMRSTC